ncbi:hypothetical protein F511_14567 [Dorcoceras hygrometricum]|uniref:Dystroglycan-like n=1 Tax=Dorcoceras hygrometricum TaxID=472368 RepID=A0A2Z7BY91_9LAMI|nr:hypothetical protein F511_14567 [Dorcoceras hygrometricum]
MASSLISNSHHIDFDSVFDMYDASLEQVFETLIATGLKNFLGCPAVFYEAALTEFFTNGSVREDGMVVSTIKGTTVEISESLFATTFDLPTEGLTDLSDVPKNLVFDARSLFSESKEQVSISCLKKELKIQYRLLHDILAKTLFVKAGSFDAVTHDRFLLMTAITFDVKVNWSNLLFGVLQAMVTPGSRQAKGFAIQIGVLLQNVQGLVLGESKGFPKSRILDAKTVHRFVHINEKVGLEESAASPRVKRTPVKKSVFKKRPALGVEDAPVIKKKRTTKGKPVVIAQEAVPPQTVEATTIAPVEQLSVPKRKSQKRKRKLVLEDATVVQKSVDEMVERVDAPVPAYVEQTAVVPVVEDDKQSDRAETWFDRAFDEMLRNDSPVVTPSDTDEEEETIDVGAAGGDQQVQFSAEGTTDDELLSIEEHQARIPFNASLLSTLAPTITKIRFGQGIEFREVDAYKASLPQIDASDKGKGILVEDDVQGHPTREIFSLICADIEFLIALRENVIEDVYIFVSSFSLRKLATLQSEDIFAKEGQVLSWAETDSSFVAIQRQRLIIAKYRELLLRKFIEASRKNFVSGTPTSAIDLKVLKLMGAAHLFALKDLLRHMREHQLEWTRPSSSSLFEGPVIDRGFFIPPNHHSITSKCWIRAKIMVDGSWLILEGVDYWRPINTPVNSRHWEALPQRPYLDDLAHSVFLLNLSKTLVPGLLFQGLLVLFGLRSVWKPFNFLSLAVYDQLDLLSLSTQIGDLVDYIHGGDAKKGEGSSSRRPLPTPVNQGESSGNVIKTT